MVNAVVQVAVKSTNLEESISFYEKVLGARFIKEFTPPGIAFVEIAGTRLLLEKNAPGCTVYYRIDDIEKACNNVESLGITLESGPHMIFKDDSGDFGDKNTEEWMAFFRDPDNNLVGLVEQRRPQED